MPLLVPSWTGSDVPGPMVVQPAGRGGGVASEKGYSSFSKPGFPPQPPPVSTHVIITSNSSGKKKKTTTTAQHSMGKAKQIL